MEDPQDLVRKLLAGLSGGLGSASAALLARPNIVEEAARTLTGKLPLIDDPLVVDYLLNTFVNKIPFPEIRMPLYRQAGMKVDPTSNIMMYAFVLVR